MNAMPIDPPPALISARRLTKTFGDFTAVRNIDFDIHSGEILGFLGPNGAGKTTTIRMIMGLLPVSSGRITIRGVDISRQPREAKNLLGYMSQKYSLYPLLSALENVEFFAGVNGMRPRQIRTMKERLAEEIAPDLLGLKTVDLPPGIRQKIALYVCLMSDPEIILLDEPTSGVDPEVRRQFWIEIYALKKSGKTIMVTTHNLDEAEYADRLLVIHRGDIILEGEPEKLLQIWGSASIAELFEEAIHRHDAS
jgi:ABC-2 type transport system ATP-binding protein